MGGDIGGFADVGSITDIAADVGSVTTDFGTEYMSAVNTTAFQVPGTDIAAAGGFNVVGSFAGDANWFNTFNSGSILSAIPKVSDFNISSLTSGLPAVSSILSNPSIINTAASAFGINPSVASTAIRAIGGQGLNISSAASAFGINPSVASTTVQAPGGTGLNVNAPTSALGTTPVTSLISQSSVIANPNAPFVELTAAETIQLEKKAPLINTLTDPSANNVTDYNQAVASKAALETNKVDYETAIAGYEKQIANSNKNIEEIQANLQDPNLSDRQRQLLQDSLTANQADVATNTQNYLDAQATLSYINDSIEIDNQIIAQTNSTATTNPSTVSSVGANIPNQYTSVYDPQTGKYSVFDNNTGTTVQTGLTEQEAILAEQNLNVGAGITLNTNTTVTGQEDPYEVARQAAIERLNVNAPTEADVISTANGQTAALTNQARAQQAVRAIRNNKAQSSDWRVRLRLAPNSNYLYKAKANELGILAPLALTDGVIFPYTPSIETAYKANYSPYDLTHSNYRGYFYHGSYIDGVNLRATFTAQDTKEADYLLAVIHFFRSCTKMFYGQDVQRGSPPPLVYLSGYGDYQFNNHPCVVSQFNYVLPPDVDYIRAQSNLQINTNQLNNRLRNPIANNPLAYSVNRLLNSNLLPGALDFRPTTPGSGNLATGNPTYVPTKMEISISLFPIQSRAQISNNFSVKEFANGNLIKGGYW